MVKMKIITPIEEPTDWVSRLVIVEKPNGQLRICLDPRHLNQAIKRPHCVMQTTDKKFSTNVKLKVSTKLYTSNAYWQIPVDDESSKLLTFNSPSGRYRFLRMPYGIHSVSDVCQNPKR